MFWIVLDKRAFRVTRHLINGPKGNEAYFLPSGHSINVSLNLKNLKREQNGLVIKCSRKRTPGCTEFYFKRELLGLSSTFKNDRPVCLRILSTDPKKNLWRRKAPCKPARRCLEFYLKRGLLRLLMTGPVDNKSQRYLFTQIHDKLYTNYVLIAKLILFVYESGPANKCATVSRCRTWSRASRRFKLFLV